MNGQSRVRAALADRGGQNLTEFMVLLVFCFGLGLAVTIPDMGTKSSGTSSINPGECIDDSAVGGFGRDATFDNKVIAIPVLENGTITAACDAKNNVPWKVTSVFANRAQYYALPIP